MTLCRESFGVL